MQAKACTPTLAISNSAFRSYRNPCGHFSSSAETGKEKCMEDQMRFQRETDGANAIENNFELK
jgi:hypothetical protein